MSWRPFCVDPSGRTSGGTRGDAWAQRPCTRLEAGSLASRRGSGGRAQERQWPPSTARTQDASGTHSRRLPPPVTSRGGHGLRERQPGGVRSSGPLRHTISLRETPHRATLEIPRALGHPQIAPHLPRPMAGGERGERGDAAREEAAGRTACGTGGGGDRDTHHPATRWVGSTSREGRNVSWELEGKVRHERGSRIGGRGNVRGRLRDGSRGSRISREMSFFGPRLR